MSKQRDMLKQLKKQIRSRITREDKLLAKMMMQSDPFEKLYGTWIKKKSNELQRQAVINSQKKKKCFLCGKKVKKFCNSHSVPKFIFSTIQNMGLVADGKETQLEGFDAFNRPGINNAGTFKLICPECDKKYFNNYESKKAILNLDGSSHNLLNMIALKTNLFKLYKRSVENELFKLIIKEGSHDPQTRYSSKISGMDMIDFEQETLHFKSAVRNSKDVTDVIFNELFDFESNIACQISFPLYLDLQNNIVVDVDNMNPNYKIEMLYVCVFPFKSQTRVILFRHKKSKKYSKFIKQFSELSETKKLKFINNAIYAYSEDFWVNPVVFDSKGFEVNKYFCKHVNTNYRSLLIDVLNYDLINFYD